MVKTIETTVIDSPGETKHHNNGHTHRSKAPRHFRLPAAEEAANVSSMRAIFLGTADGHTSAKREHSGILLQTKETSILLDCGAAAARFLLGKKIDANVPEIALHQPHAQRSQRPALAAHPEPLAADRPCAAACLRSGHDSRAGARLAGEMPPFPPSAHRLPDRVAPGQTRQAVFPRTIFR